MNHSYLSIYIPFDVPILLFPLLFSFYILFSKKNKVENQNKFARYFITTLYLFLLFCTAMVFDNYLSGIGWSPFGNEGFAMPVIELFFSPLISAIGVAHFILSHYQSTSKRMQSLPFLIAFLIHLPVFTETLHRPLIILGIFLSAFLWIALFILSILEIKLWFKKY